MTTFNYFWGSWLLLNAYVFSFTMFENHLLLFTTFDLLDYFWLLLQTCEYFWIILHSFAYLWLHFHTFAYFCMPMHCILLHTSYKHLHSFWYIYKPFICLHKCVLFFILLHIYAYFLLKFVVQQIKLEAYGSTLLTNFPKWHKPVLIGLD